MKTIRKTHPMILVAAASVTALSLTGIASMAGWMPVHANTSRAATPLTSIAAPTATTTAKLESPATLNIPAGATVTVEPKPAPRTTSARAPRPAPQIASTELPPQAQQPGYTHVANTSTQPMNDNGIYVENARSNAGTSPAPALCNSCGTVQGVQEISSNGEGTGLGAVAGGVLGGLLGSQVGGGNGKKVMAVLGAVGGAFAGHETEKRVRAEKQYQINVRFDDGSSRTYTENDATQLQSGDRVRLEDGRLLML